MPAFDVCRGAFLCHKPQPPQPPQAQHRALCDASCFQHGLGAPCNTALRRNARRRGKLNGYFCLRRAHNARADFAGAAMHRVHLVCNGAHIRDFNHDNARLCARLLPLPPVPGADRGPGRRRGCVHGGAVVRHNFFDILGNSGHVIRLQRLASMEAGNYRDGFGRIYWHCCDSCNSGV